MRSHISYARIGLFVTLAWIAGGCASPSPSPTKVISSMDTPTTGRQPVRKVMVVAMLRRPEIRKLIEDEYARQLGAHGVQAVQGYTLMTEPDQVTRERLKQEASRVGADAVLISGVVRREANEVTTPGILVNSRGEYRPGYPPLSYEAYQQAPETEQQRTNFIETKVFDARSNDLLWTAQTETVVMTDPNRHIPGFVQAIVAQMAKDHIVP